jgi:hypothetical protein
LLFSQRRYVRLDVNSNIDRAGKLFIQRIFQILSNLVGGSHIQIPVNQDMKVEKNLSSDGARAETVVLTDLAVGLNYIFYLVDYRMVNGTFG